MSFEVESFPRAIPVGYWHLPHLPEDTAGLPTPVPDTSTLTADERDIVSVYLMRADLPAVAYRGDHRCLICGCPTGCSDVCDGTYVWPSGLAHYVGDHGVELSRAFVDHIIASPQRVPSETRRGWMATSRASRRPTPGGQDIAVAPTREGAIAEAHARVGEIGRQMAIDAVPVEALVVAGTVVEVREVGELEIAGDVAGGLAGRDDN